MTGVLNSLDRLKQLAWPTSKPSTDAGTKPHATASPSNVDEDNGYGSAGRPAASNESKEMTTTTRRPKLPVYEDSNEHERARKAALEAEWNALQSRGDRYVDNR